MITFSGKISQEVLSKSTPLPTVYTESTLVMPFTNTLVQAHLFKSTDLPLTETGRISQVALRWYPLMMMDPFGVLTPPIRSGSLRRVMEVIGEISMVPSDTSRLEEESLSEPIVPIKSGEETDPMDLGKISQEV